VRQAAVHRPEQTLGLGRTVREVDVPEVEEHGELRHDLQVLTPARGVELGAERLDQRLHQRAEVAGPTLGLEPGHHPVTPVLDAAVVTDDDRVQQAVTTAEVVVQRRRVPLPSPLDDALERDLVDAVVCEEGLRRREQPLPGIRRVASHARPAAVSQRVNAGLTESAGI
jgi:hypothetical protein